MPTRPQQLLHLKHLLHNFAASTSLKVNYSKSMMVPLNISETKLQSLAEIFEWQKGSLPLTYLDLPLGTTKPKMEHFLPLIQKIEKKLGSTSMFLSQGGKLEMVNSVFSSSAVYYASTLKLHKGVIKQLDRFRKHCLWRGGDISSKNPQRLRGQWHVYQKTRGVRSGKHWYTQWGVAAQISP